MLGVQQRHQFACGVECHEVIASAHVGCANVDLRNCASPCGVHHVKAGIRIGVDANLGDLLHAPRLEQLLRAYAKRAYRCCVHRDGLHDSLGFVDRQICIPPRF